MKKIKWKKNIKKEKGFVILIAIVISGLLVSLGLFIANIAYKELILSNSAKDSQRAFFAADSVMECALRYDIYMGGFKENKDDSDDNANEFALPCNDKSFKPEPFNEDLDYATSVYYVSLSDSVDDTDDDDNVIDLNEIVTQINNNDDVRTSPLVKLLVEKSIDTSSTSNRSVTKITAYGHNIAKGKGIVERAIQVTY